MDPACYNVSEQLEGKLENSMANPIEKIQGETKLISSPTIGKIKPESNVATKAPLISAKSETAHAVPGEHRATGVTGETPSMKDTKEDIYMHRAINLEEQIMDGKAKLEQIAEQTPLQERIRREVRDRNHQDALGTRDKEGRPLISTAFEFIHLINRQKGRPSKGNSLKKYTQEMQFIEKHAMKILNSESRFQYWQDFNSTLSNTRHFGGRLDRDGVASMPSKPDADEVPMAIRGSSSIDWMDLGMQNEKIFNQISSIMALELDVEYMKRELNKMELLSNDAGNTLKNLMNVHESVKSPNLSEQA